MVCDSLFGFNDSPKGGWVSTGPSVPADGAGEPQIAGAKAGEAHSARVANHRKALKHRRRRQVQRIVRPLTGEASLRSMPQVKPMPERMSVPLLPPSDVATGAIHRQNCQE